jgi:hypothetical protein
MLSPVTQTPTRAAVQRTEARESAAPATAGELLERYLFFTAVVAPKMPGVPAS